MHSKCGSLGLADELIRRFLQFRHRISDSNVKLHRKSNIDFRNCTFEGNNSVGDLTVLRNCSLGRGTYIADRSILYMTSIGRFSSISSDVRIVAGKHPSQTFVSTHPCFYSTVNQSGLSYVDKDLFESIQYADPIDKRLVTIGNDVWIGYGARIFDGVTVSDGTIVAAGAVVTKSTEPYSIVGGVPAKPIRKRFSDETIEFLLDLKWWDKDEAWLRDHAQEFDDIEKFLSINGKI